MEPQLDLDFEHYTVAWIAPLRIEAQAAWYMLDNEHQGSFAMDRGDDYVYTAGDINGHNVVIATFPRGYNYGVGSAAALAGQVRKSFPNLWFGLLVGVAAGLPDLSRIPPRDIRLGDVLVGVGEGDSAGIIGYGLGKETSNGFELLNHGALAKTEKVVSSAIGNIESYEPMHGNVFLKYYESIKDKNHTNGTFADPGQEKDQLYQTVDEENSQVIKLVERPMRQPSERTKVWYGSIGSGDKLMKNAEKRDKLRDEFDLIGLEMEAAGTMDTIPVGVIRGVCDYGDEKKKKEWQPYAAAMAAAYAKAVLYKIRPKRNRREEALQALKARRLQEASPRNAKKHFTFIPFSRNDDFIVREEVLKALDKLLTPYGTYHTAAIWGLGGCGKTQIALEYAYRRQESTSCSIFWVHADSEARFNEDYSEIAKLANLPLDLKGEDLLRTVQQWIEQQTSWLLVLDNVDELRVFKKSSDRQVDKEQLPSPALLRFVPKGPNGTVIWTSRDGGILGRLVGVNRGINVGAMTDEESMSLFQRLCRETLTNKASGVEELLNLLQKLPLAIAQAAAYIRRTKISIQAYLRAFKESEKRQSNLLSEEFDDVYRLGVPNSVMLTWLISMKQISQESLCGEKILNTIAFFDNQGLPFELIRAAASPEYDEDQVLSAASRLIEYSFLQAQRTVDEGLPVYEQHRLVQLAARRALNVQQTRLYSGKALKIMTNLFPRVKFETWDSCKLYLPHSLKAVVWLEAEEYSSLAPNLLARIGSYYWEQGLSDKAEQIQVQALELQKEVLGEKHPDTITAMGDLAATWRHQGRLNEAEQLEVQVLKLRKEVQGEKHPYTITALANLAATWQRLGQLEKAEQLQVQVLELRKEVLGEKHPGTIRAMSKLAATWWQQGRLDQAEQLEVQVLELQKEVLGEKHPYTITAMANLAATWREQGRLDEAEQFEVQALKLRKEVLGEKHPYTITAMANLASTWQRQDQLDKAEQLQVQVLELRKEVLGEKHPGTIRSMASLASTWRQQGRLDKAEHLEAQVLELQLQLQKI